MIISDSKKFIFVHVYKTGGTSIRHVLYGYRSNDEKYSKLPQHASARAIRDCIGEEKWNEYFTFAVVRNPWDLLVSKYHYGLRVGHKDPKYSEPFNREVFNNFVRKHAGSCQMKSLIDEDGKILVKKIVPFENLNEEMNAILEKLGIKKSIPHLNKSIRGEYREYFDDETRDIVKSCCPDVSFFKMQF